jgi:hypothetical protein
MADTTSARAETAAAQREQAVVRQEPTGWVGWIMFAGIMLVLAGALHAVWGLVAILNDTWVVWANQENLVLDLTAWGWLHLAAGAVLVLSGIGLFTGNVLARTVAVVVAGASLLANFVTIPAYPVWALTIMVIDILVIYAVVAHGREVIDLR